MDATVLSDDARTFDRTNRTTAESVMKRLILLRHGKSEWGNADLDDFDRPLAPRGIKASKKIGKLLLDLDLVPQRALCSEAVRAKQTWDLVVDAIGRKVETTFRGDLYLAEPKTLLAAAAGAPNSCDALILIAHNPGLERLTDMLLADGEADAVANLGDSYPTAGLAVFECAIDGWDELPRTQAYLSHFVRPRQL